MKRLCKSNVKPQLVLFVPNLYLSIYSKSLFTDSYHTGGHMYTMRISVSKYLAIE